MLRRLQIIGIVLTSTSFTLAASPASRPAATAPAEPPEAVVWRYFELVGERKFDHAVDECYDLREVLADVYKEHWTRTAARDQAEMIAAQRIVSMDLSRQLRAEEPFGELVANRRNGVARSGLLSDGNTAVRITLRRFEGDAYWQYYLKAVDGRWKIIDHGTTDPTFNTRQRQAWRESADAHRVAPLAHVQEMAFISEIAQKRQAEAAAAKQVPLTHPAVQALRDYVALLQGPQPDKAVDQFWALDVMIAGIFGDSLKRYSTKEQSDMTRRLGKAYQRIMAHPEIAEGMAQLRHTMSTANELPDGTVTIRFTSELKDLRTTNVYYLRKLGEGWKIVDMRFNRPGGATLVEGLRHFWEIMPGPMTPLDALRLMEKEFERIAGKKVDSETPKKKGINPPP